ncbi:hypothetical protein BpHYR1_043179 [Brachionus plicatilis]|uniref:Uncharacterized protein n=1 Tax=Brachionus plicatilis TaxID=10195 RepID=A0A3M7R9Q5_BRAPC|nr:hypothetical protein BpHYR1_043179 [Brachionus plicatilis]
MFLYRGNLKQATESTPNIMRMNLRGFGKDVFLNIPKICMHLKCLCTEAFVNVPKFNCIIPTSRNKNKQQHLYDQEEFRHSDL